MLLIYCNVSATLSQHYFNLFVMWAQNSVLLRIWWFNFTFYISYIICIIFQALAPILYMIAEDWLRMKSNKERRIMIKCAKIPRMIIICGFIIMFASFILLFILPCFGITMRYMTNVTDPGKPLPLQTYYLYDTNVSPYFELTFVAQGITLMISAMGYTAIDSLFGLLVFHVCGQLENLKDRLLYPRKDLNFDRILKDAITDHIRLIRYIILIMSIFFVCNYLVLSLP